MRRIAAQEHAPVPVTVDDHGSRGPSLLAENFVVERETERVVDCGAMIVGIEIRVRPEEGVVQPQIRAIDGNDLTFAIRVVDPVHPAGPVRPASLDLRRADIRRAEFRHDFASGESRTHAVPDRAARTFAGHEVAAPDRVRLTARDMQHLAVDVIGVLGVIEEAPAFAIIALRELLRVLAQHGFHRELRHPVLGFRSWPVSVDGAGMFRAIDDLLCRAQGVAR